MKRRSGFTILELLITLAIIGVLVGLSLVAFAPAKSSVRTKGVKADMMKFDAAIRDFKALRKREPYYLNELVVDDVPRDKAGCYLDPWGTPYVLLTGTAIADMPDPVTRSQAIMYRQGITAYTTGGNWFFRTSTYATPYQIISAGPDGKFGPGGELTPGVGAWSAGQPGEDDIVSFRDKVLGTP